jgi:hypothetical protein
LLIGDLCPPPEFGFVDPTDLGAQIRIGAEVIDIGEEAVKHIEDLRRPGRRVLLVERQEHDLEFFARHAAVNQQAKQHRVWSNHGHPRRPPRLSHRQGFLAS